MDLEKGEKLVVGRYRNGDLCFDFMERFSHNASTILEFQITDLSASILSGQFKISDMPDGTAEEHLRGRLAFMQEKKES